MPTLPAWSCRPRTPTTRLARASVRLSGARAEPLGAPGGLGRDLQRALLAAESVGAADGCLAMARDYAVDRVAFGRPIGSYQAIKHKLVEMLRRVEGARSLFVAAGRAWDADRPGFGHCRPTPPASALARHSTMRRPRTSSSMAGLARRWEHDASLYYRRAELSRRLCGGVEAAAEAVAGELLGVAGLRGALGLAGRCRARARVRAFTVNCGIDGWMDWAFAFCPARRHTYDARLVSSNSA